MKITRANRNKQRAEKAVNTVRAHLIKRGFELNKKISPFSNGYDISAWNGELCFRIEVKNVRFSSRRWLVDKVHSPHGTDIIAMVFDGNRIIFSTASDHMKLCSPCGSRSVTELKKLIDNVL